MFLGEIKNSLSAFLFVTQGSPQAPNGAGRIDDDDDDDDDDNDD